MLIRRWGTDGTSYSTDRNSPDFQKYKNSLVAYKKSLLSILENFYFEIQTDFKEANNIINLSLNNKKVVSIDKNVEGNYSDLSIRNIFQKLIQEKIISEISQESTNLNNYITTLKTYINTKISEISVLLKRIKVLEDKIQYNEGDIEKNIENIINNVRNLKKALNAIAIPTSITYIYGNNKAPIYTNHITLKFNYLLQEDSQIETLSNNILKNLQSISINSILNKLNISNINKILDNIIEQTGLNIVNYNKNNKITAKNNQSIDIAFDNFDVSFKIRLGGINKILKKQSKSVSESAFTISSINNKDINLILQRIQGLQEEAIELNNATNLQRTQRQSANNLRDLTELVHLIMIQKNALKRFLDQNKNPYDVGGRMTPLEQQIINLWSLSNVNLKTDQKNIIEKQNTALLNKTNFENLMIVILVWAETYESITNFLSVSNEKESKLYTYSAQQLYKITNSIQKRRMEYAPLRAWYGWLKEEASGNYDETEVETRTWYLALDDYVKRNTKISIDINNNKLKKLQEDLKTKVNYKGYKTNILQAINKLRTSYNNYITVQGQMHNALKNDRQTNQQKREIQKKYTKEQRNILNDLSLLIQLLTTA